MSQKLENEEKIDDRVTFPSLKIKTSKVFITYKTIFSMFSFVFPIDKKKKNQADNSCPLLSQRRDEKRNVVFYYT